MRYAKKYFVWMIICFWATPGLAAGLEGFQGTWKGPWYIGMSSGKVALEISKDGQGNISMTQLDGFGDSPVPLKKISVDGNIIRFAAAGENGVELSLKATLDGTGKRLVGNGKHGGFGARLELQRQP
ncbi:MAG: hypothetical protein ACKVP2_18050 [Burkholderiales bacterium]